MRTDRGPTFGRGIAAGVAAALRSRCAIAIACVTILGFASGTAFAGGFTVSKSLPYATEVTASAKLREACKLHLAIPAAIAANSTDVQLVDGKGSVRLEITVVHGPGGGAFSGPKWLEVQGGIRSGGKNLNFRAKRYSAMDIFSGGTCGILQKCARAMGKDIATWLAAPTPDAKLGDAK